MAYNQYLDEVKLQQITSLVHISYSSEKKIDIEIPVECTNCKFSNFYVWGTLVNSRLKIEVRCIKCGKKNCDLDNERR